MKSEQLQAIRERCEKATPGPWYASHERRGEYVDSVGDVIAKCISDQCIDDTEFIAHTREDVPALLDEIERLQPHNLVAQVDELLKLGVDMRRDIERFRGALEFIQKHRMMVGEIAYIAARNALGNEGKSYAQIYGGQDDPTVAAIKEHRQALAGESE